MFTHIRFHVTPLLGVLYLDLICRSQPKTNSYASHSRCSPELPAICTLCVPIFNLDHPMGNFVEENHVSEFMPIRYWKKFREKKSFFIVGVSLKWKLKSKST